MVRRLGVTFCVLGILLVLGPLAGLLAGQRGGLGHFSPHTLEYTTQSEFAVPGLPIYRSARRPVRNELVDFLVEEGFVVPVQPQKQRWEVVFHWNEAWKDGHGYLYRMLVRDRKELIKWSKADPQRARLYWSEVFRLLRSERKADLFAGHVLVERWRDCETVADVREWLGKAKAEGEELYPQP